MEHSLEKQAVLEGKIEVLDYCLYARKSSEADERQAMSIDSQIKEMQEAAEKNGLQIKEILKESHSAKDSGQRPVFNTLIKEIREGKYNAILTWAPDRLSRNAGDLGSLVDLMDQGLLKEIKTNGQHFTNTPSEKFLLMILCSQAKLENDNKAINVKRGQRAKIEMGVRPCLPPLGYKDRTYKDYMGKVTLDQDPLRAPIIKQMFEKVGLEGQSGRDILNWMNEIGFTTRTGKRMALSNIYNLLKTPFYYGSFEYPEGSGKWYKGIHEALITKELFDMVQMQMKVAPKSKRGSKEFSFRKIFVCGACGSGVTAEEKFKRLKDGTVRRYIYYHCTGGRDRQCKQQYISEEELINQLSKIIDEIEIDKFQIHDLVYQEVRRYNMLMNSAFTEPQVNVPKIENMDAKKYAKQVLLNGTKDQKREVLSYFKTQLYIKDKIVYTE